MTRAFSSGVPINPLLIFHVPRTAESVVFTLCPPEPLLRMVSKEISYSGTVNDVLVGIYF